MAGDVFHWDPGAAAEQAFQQHLIQEGVLLLHEDMGQRHSLKQLREELWDSSSSALFWSVPGMSQVHPSPSC